MRWLVTVIGVLAMATSVVADRPIIYFEQPWSSCPDPDDGWTEMAFRHRATGGGTDWNLHLGPRTEFALFKGDYIEGQHIPHDDPRNLLGAGYDFTSVPMAPKRPRSWTIPSLGLHLQVNRVEPSRDDWTHNCETFYVVVESYSVAKVAHRH